MVLSIFERFFSLQMRQEDKMYDAKFFKAWEYNTPMVNFSSMVKEWESFYPLLSEAIEKDLAVISAYHWLQLRTSGYIPLGSNTQEVVKKFSTSNSSTALFLLMQKELNLKGFIVKGNDLIHWDQKLYL